MIHKVNSKQSTQQLLPQPICHLSTLTCWRATEVPNSKLPDQLGCALPNVQLAMHVTMARISFASTHTTERSNSNPQRTSCSCHCTAHSPPANAMRVLLWARARALAGSGGDAELQHDATCCCASSIYYRMDKLRVIITSATARATTACAASNVAAPVAAIMAAT
jgi:hypothetical protein